MIWCLFSDIKLDCPAALERIKEGRPITTKDDKGNTSKAIADTVSVSKKFGFFPVTCTLCQGMAGVFELFFFFVNFIHTNSLYTYNKQHCYRNK